MTGYIKLRRSLLDWEWYGDHNATRLLIHLLISVNYEDKKWQGIIVKKGSMVLSWATLSARSKLSIKQCRVAMQKLEESGEVARKVTNKYQVVTLVKWEKIQLDHLEEANNGAGKGQAKGRQRATTKEREEYKETYTYVEGKKRFLPPTVEQVDELFLEKGMDFNSSKRESERFVNFYSSKNWMVGKNKMKLWKSAAANWYSKWQEKKEKEVAPQKEKINAGVLLQQKIYGGTKKQ